MGAAQNALLVTAIDEVLKHPEAPGAGDAGTELLDYASNAVILNAKSETQLL